MALLVNPKPQWPWRCGRLARLREVEFLSLGSIHGVSRVDFPAGASAAATRRIGSRGNRCTAAMASSSATFSSSAAAKLVAVVGEGSKSPLRGTPWLEVMNHMVNRVRWTDDRFELLVFTDKSELPSIEQADILLGVGIHDPQTIDRIANSSSSIPTRIYFDSAAANSTTYLGGVKVLPLDTPADRLRSIIPGSNLSRSLKVLDLVTDAWNRQSSDNICFALLVLIDSFVTPVKLLKNLRATTLSSIRCMSMNCGKEILACLLDPTCRAALDCLNRCAPNDQVCSYRCIVSYETLALEAFSRCILQKNNCLGLGAEIPTEPDVGPMEKFRGIDLTHAAAEEIFIGSLGSLRWSWRVAAGQNAAYDYFPNQFQIFYRGRAKNSMWYDPVFQVETLDRKLVWRRRHYRVRRGRLPGTFHFSVLDNGVISKEFWRIVDCSDDLSWGLFYYSGAAAAAGQAYSGAVLVSPDGMWPGQRHQQRIDDALERCGIRVWEMYSVDNSVDGDDDQIPLGLPETTSIDSPTSIVR